MGKFMHYSANAVRISISIVFPTVDLARTGITAQIHPIILIIGVIVHIKLMRPQIATVVAREIGRIARNDKVNHVHNAIAVTVILAEVNRRIDLVDSRHKNISTIVGTLGRSARVIHLHGADNVELRVEHTHTVVMIIVPGTTGTWHEITTGTIITRVVLLVHHVVEIIVAIGERTVSVLDKHHQATEILIVGPARSHQFVSVGTHALALRHSGFVSQSFLEVGEHSRLTGTTHLRVVGNDIARNNPCTRLNSIHIVAIAPLQHRVTVGSGRVVMELIAHQLQRQGGAITLLNVNRPWMGRNSTSRHCTGNHQQKYAHTFHHLLIHSQLSIV